MFDYSGKVYITVRDNHSDVTRIDVCNTEYANALDDVLNNIGYKASHVPSVCTVGFYRDCAELDRLSEILRKIIKIKGGLSLIDLKS
jgi:hypothetical protein